MTILTPGSPQATNFQQSRTQSASPQATEPQTAHTGTLFGGPGPGEVSSGAAAMPVHGPLPNSLPNSLPEFLAGSFPGPVRLYRYRALDGRGTLVCGYISAQSRLQAQIKLTAMGLQTFWLRPGAWRFALGCLLSARALGSVDISQQCDLFLTYMGYGLKAGAGLTQTLVLVEQTLKPPFKEIVVSIRAQVQQGALLSASLADYPMLFSPAVVALIQLGEQSGELARACTKAAGYLAQNRALRSNFSRLLAYPALNLALLSLVMIVVRSALLPQVLELIRDRGQPLPLSTQLVKGLPRVLMTVIPLGVMGGLWVKHRQPGWLLRVFKAGMVRGPYAQFYRSIALLASEQIPLAPALDLATRACTTRLLAPYFAQVRQDFHAGYGLAGALRRLPHIPPLACSLVQAGESTGHPVQGITAAAQLLEQDHQRELDRLQFWLPPLLMGILGCGFWLIISGAFLPLYQAMGQMTYDL